MNSGGHEAKEQKESFGMNQLAARRRRGAVTTEAALILPLFLIFWFGIADWGITFWVHQTIVHRANMAARWGTANSWDPNAIRNLVVYGGTTGSGSGIFGMSAQGNGDGTGANVDVRLRCLTKLTPKLQTGAACLDARWADSRWIQINVHDYSWTHFTPFFAGRFVGRQVIVSLPGESLGGS